MIWRKPDGGRRYIIGELQREPDCSYRFCYSHEVHEALADGFGLLPDFPALRMAAEPYRSRWLFPMFTQRIPSPRRSDYEAIVRSWGVTRPDDAMQVLAFSGGAQMTDRIELAEYRPIDDPLETPLLFRIAGGQYYEAEGEVSAGQQLGLVRETTNAHDADAVYVVVSGGKKLGYVPRQYSALVARHLDAGRHLDARAMHRLVMPGDSPRWVVQLTRE